MASEQACYNIRRPSNKNGLLVDQACFLCFGRAVASNVCCWLGCCNALFQKVEQQLNLTSGLPCVRSAVYLQQQTNLQPVA